MTRVQRILTIVLVLQIVLAGVVYWPRQAGVAGNQPLLDEFNPEEVVSLEIEDNTGVVIQLAKVGGDWQLPEADGFPVDAAKVTPVLEKLQGIDKARLVTQTVASHDQLEVSPNNFQRRLRIGLSDGSEIVLYLGSSAGSAATHVRLSDQSPVYLTGEIASWEAGVQASNWIDTTYLSIPSDQVTEVTLENANGRFVFRKDLEETWRMEGLSDAEVFNAGSLTSMLNQISSLRMTEPLGTRAEPAYGLADPQAVLTLTWRDGEAGTRQTTLRLGASDETTYVAAASESDYIVKVNSYAVSSLVENTREDFLTLTPTPTPLP